MSASTVERCCTFRVGAACFAVPTEGVVEVLRAGVPTRVPLAPGAVRGLVHLRGRIVPVVDPAPEGGLDRGVPGRVTLLVLSLQDDWYALVIDELLDVVDIPAAAIEEVAPGRGAGSDGHRGIFAAPDRLVHVLDPGVMIHSLLRPQPQVFERQGVPHGRP